MTLRRLYLRALKKIVRSSRKFPWIHEFIKSQLPSTTVTYLDCKLIVHPSNNFTEFFLWRRGVPPEHEAISFLAEIFRGRNTTMVDVGANVGLCSLPIAKAVAPQSNFILFEPNPVLQRRLAKNVELNGLSNVHLSGCAIGDEEVRTELWFPVRDNLGEGRIGLAYASSDRKPIPVEVRPLPACLAELGIGHVDLLKVDIEGLEDRAIVPLLRVETAPKPGLIYFEDRHQEHWKHDLIALLASSGYSEWRRFEGNALYRRAGTAGV